LLLILQPVGEGKIIAFDGVPATGDFEGFQGTCIW
jgi:hypothetical protein